MTKGQSGGKDRQASFPTKRPLEKLAKKRNPHRQDSSVAAWSPYCRCGSSRPFLDCSRKRHSFAEAREPTSLARRCWSSGGVRHRPALPPKLHGPARVVQRHLAGPPCGSQAPLPLLSEAWAVGFPRPGGLLADHDGAAVGSRPFGLSTSLFRGSSVEP